MLFERSEFMVFRKTHLFLAFFVQRRPFLASLNFATLGIKANKFAHCPR
jgi:hypothetical protein